MRPFVPVELRQVEARGTQPFIERGIVLEIDIDSSRQGHDLSLERPVSIAVVEGVAGGGWNILRHVREIETELQASGWVLPNVFHIVLRAAEDVVRRGQCG